MSGTAAADSASSARHTDSSFVTRSGNQLVVDGSTFRFAGANLYWLGLDNNIRSDDGQPTYPTEARIDNALRAAKDAGFTVIRSHTLGISVGCPRCFEPRVGVFEPAALRSADYAVYRAGMLGLRIVVPLTDQWRWYHGSLSTFTGWKGYPNFGNPTDNSVNAANSWSQRNSESHFYTDRAVINDFKWYVAHLVEHVNTYTGVAYKDDPTILAWETGNELWTATPTWTADIATYLKEYVGVHQLVADGSAAAGMSVGSAALAARNVDIVGGHFYPVDVSWMTRDAAIAAAHDKVYLVGEYDWRSIDATRSLLSAVETDRNIAGALLWALLPYLEDGTPEQSGDGLALYNPATTPDMQTVLSMLTAHAAVMSRG